MGSAPSSIATVWVESHYDGLSEKAEKNLEKARAIIRSFRCRDPERMVDGNDRQRNRGKPKRSHKWQRNQLLLRRESGSHKPEAPAPGHKRSPGAGASGLCACPGAGASGL